MTILAFLDLAAVMLFISVSLLSYLLYQRWRTSNYRFIQFTYIAAAAVYTILLIIEVFMTNEWIVFLKNYTALLFIGGSLLAFYHYFRPIEQNIWLSAVFYAAGLMVSAAISAFSFSAAVIFSFAVSALYIAYVWMAYLPHLPKQSYFQISMVFAGAYIFFTHLALLFKVQAFLITGSVMFILALTMFMVIFFSRVVDMVESVTLSAVSDGLTTLFNKSYFLRKLDSLVEANAVYAIVFSDIDNFKTLNDTHGHHIGDEILNLTGRIMKEVFRNTGIAARYGGEEMVAAITNADADVAILAELFRSRVEEESKPIAPVTVSVGVFYSQEGLTPRELLDKADTAMYEAKKMGKNRVVINGFKEDSEIQEEGL